MAPIWTKLKRLSTREIVARKVALGVMATGMATDKLLCGRNATARVTATRTFAEICMLSWILARTGSQYWVIFSIWLCQEHFLKWCARWPTFRWIDGKRCEVYVTLWTLHVKCFSERRRGGGARRGRVRDSSPIKPGGALNIWSNYELSKKESPLKEAVFFLSDVIETTRDLPSYHIQIRPSKKAHLTKPIETRLPVQTFCADVSASDHLGTHASCVLVSVPARVCVQLFAQLHAPHYLLLAASVLHRWRQWGDFCT